MPLVTLNYKTFIFILSHNLMLVWIWILNVRLFCMIWKLTSITNWCARQIISMSFAWLNCATTSEPKRYLQEYTIVWEKFDEQLLVILDAIGLLYNRKKTYPAPLGLTPQPCVSSGSDQRRSHIGPSCGTSCFLSIVLIWSNVCMLGDNPPCTQNI